MRFPIRSQMMLSTSIVMVGVVIGSAAINAWLAQRSARSRIQARVEEVTEILSHESFPLTGRVLKSVAGLSGAEFVLVDTSGRFVGTSNASLSTAKLPSTEHDDGGLGEVRTVAGDQYFHRVVRLNNARIPSELTLHVLFSANEYRRVWQRAIVPSLLAVCTALAAALTCAFWVGGSVSSSTKAILNQLDSITKGNFRPARLPSRDDEMKDISVAINHTAALLDTYEANVREGERMKTMVAMGAGLAHQIRNSVTGCRMALDIVADESDFTDHEATKVARRQLSLMENYLQRFLLLAKVEPERIVQEVCDLNVIVDDAVSLVRHSANHLHVHVQWTPEDRELSVKCDVIAVEQAIVNLLLNAIEAASAVAVTRAKDKGLAEAAVRVDLRLTSDASAEIIVGDNGPGPNPEQDVFAPFVSQKTNGIGLGLAVVKEVAEEHGGGARWQRRDGWTEFTIEIPLSEGGEPRVECADR